MRIQLALLLTACSAPHAASPSNQVAANGGPELTATITPFEGKAPAGEDLGEATVRTPFITVAGNAPASAAINAALEVPNTAEALAKVTELGDVGLDYEVGYNHRGLLDVTIMHETMGAHPDAYSTHFVFDLTTGKKLTSHDVLRDDARAKLVALLDQQLQASLAEARNDPADPSCTQDGTDLYQGTFTDDELDGFGLTDKGVRFIHNFAFPHYMQACEPTGTFELSYSEAALYLRAEGPAGRLPR